MISNSNLIEYYRSQRSSQSDLVDAAATEIENDYSDAMESMARSYEEGFLDGMRHAFVLITGDEPHGESANTIIGLVSAALKSGEVSAELQNLCQHSVTMGTDIGDGAQSMSCTACLKTLHTVHL
jgi:hypothetical protein